MKKNQQPAIQLFSTVFRLFDSVRLKSDVFSTARFRLFSTSSAAYFDSVRGFLRFRRSVRVCPRSSSTPPQRSSPSAVFFDSATAFESVAVIFDYAAAFESVRGLLRLRRSVRVLLRPSSTPPQHSISSAVFFDSAAAFDSVRGSSSTPSAASILQLSFFTLIHIVISKNICIFIQSSKSTMQSHTIPSGTRNYTIPSGTPKHLRQSK